MKDFNNFKSNLTFTFECDRNSINLLDLNVKIFINTYIIGNLIPTILTGHLFRVKIYRQVMFI